MKNKAIIITLAALMAVPSCSLREDTSSVSTPDNFFRKFSECQSVVNGCYIPLAGIYTYAYFLATECVSDLAYCYSGTLDACLDISPAVPRFGETVWTQAYRGIQRCNFAVKGITETTALNESQRNSLLCEAKTLRGFYYLTLTSFFGNVPFYFDDVTDKETLERIALLPRMDAVATRDEIIKDLKEIAPLVPQTRTSDNDGARLGAAAAYMVIAKCAMWNKEWDVALEALGKIEDIYGDFSQYDYAENVMFRNKNTPESILEIQHSYVLGGINYTSNVACVCTPTRSTGFTYDGVEIEELGDQSTTWSAMRPNSYFCQGLQSKKSFDIRKDYNMAWEYNGKTFNSTVVRPWAGPKFWCPNMQGSDDGNNYKVFRYADALLMMAECHQELNQDETAVKYLNYTRERAGLGPYHYRNNARLQDEIRCERARELFGEFQRKFDLVRWDIFYQSLTDYSDQEELKKNIRPCHRYYPIPDREVVNSKYNLDNKEYNKYGL